MIQELHTLRTSESFLIQQNNFYSNQINEIENKFTRLQQDYNDQVIECQEAIDFMTKQKHEIQVLRNETKESYQTKQMIQNELKLFKLQYEKLERAFVESIEKFMNHKIVILDEREERP
jgi:galactokinase